MRPFVAIDVLSSQLKEGELTRRRFFSQALGFSLAGLAAGNLAGVAQEGSSSRNLKPQPRGKPSGVPFDARFTDVALQAGLTQPVIYGEIDQKSVISVTVGCGGALLVYASDGWLDIFV